MRVNKYIYSFGHENNEKELCLLEARFLFNSEVQNKLLFSNIVVDPAHSAFIKNRLEIISFSEDFATLISEIKKEQIHIENFKIEYLVFDGDSTTYPNRLGKLREIGFSIEGMHEYYNPTTIYGLCKHQGIWYFSILTKNSFDWNKHKQKPHSFSNSINVNIAKSLVNIAVNTNKENKLLDACCGMGTIMLEACYAGFKIEGCDINEKICNDARQNLSHFSYSAKIHNTDIKNLNLRFDAVIIDLPYNLFTKVSDHDIEHIIEASAKITDRLIIVSTSDITDIISNIGFKISDYCSVSKRGRVNFARKIWVCENENPKRNISAGTA